MMFIIDVGVFNFFIVASKFYILFSLFGLDFLHVMMWSWSEDWLKIWVKYGHGYGAVN